MRRFWPRPFFNSEGGSGGAGVADEAAPPAGLEAFWDADAKTLRADDLVRIAREHGELSTFKAEHDARLAALPQKPEDIELALPADFTLPEGVEVSFDEADPLTGEMRALAHEARLPPEIVSRFLALKVKSDLANEQARLEAANAEYEAEKAKLGEAAGERVRVVDAFLKANLSEPQYEAVRIVATNAAALEAVEKLIELANGGALPGAGASTNQAAKPTDLAKRLFPSMN